MVAAGFVCRWIVCILLAFRTVNSLRLSEPRILLPFSHGLPTNFTLGTDEDHCFEWTSNNPLYVAITPIYSSQGCSKSAIISSIYHSNQRKVVRITASTVIDSNPAELYCDVILDNLRDIEIRSLIDKVSVGDLPEKVTLQGKDEFGHFFSSLNGFEVEWILSKENVDEPSSIMRLEKVIDSRYGSYKDISGLEKRELHGSNILLFAVEPGSCLLCAKVQYKEKIFTSNQIRIDVDPPFRVFPSEHFALLRHALVDIYVEKLQGGLPDGRIDSYTLESGVEKFSGEEYGLQQINLVSKDSSFPDKNIEVNVVKPKYLAFKISGCSEFSNLETLKTYVVSIDLFDENNQEIFPSENLRVAVKFATKLFHVHSSTSNGTYHVVQAVSPGKGKIEAELKGVELQDGSRVKDAEIKKVQKVNVYQKLEIYPPVVHLPSYTSEPNTPLYEIDLKVAGGSRHFGWSSSDKAAGRLIVPSNESATVKLQVFKESNFVVSAFDKNNLENVAVSKIFVQAVTDIEVYPTVVEAVIGNTIILPVALLGKESKDSEIIQKFNDCFKIKPQVDIIEKHVVRYDPDPFIPGFGKGCLSLNLQCTSAGYSRINVAYNDFKTTTVVSCFKPLKPIHPVRVAVLPVGAYKEVAFDGGPRRFPLFKEGHYTNLVASDPDSVDIQLVRDPIRYNKDLTVFLIKCKALGENTLEFTIGNEKSATNAHPAKEQTSIKIICSKPSSVHLKLPKSTSKRETQLPDNVVKVPFYGEKKFSVDLFVKDDMGRKFSNISSLKIEFDVSNKDLASFESPLGVTTYINAVEGYRKVSRNFKEFQMSGSAGKLKISAKIVGYLEDALEKAEVPIPSDKFEEISTDIDLDLVSLRDINAGLYSSDSKDTCDGDTCKY